MDTTALLSILRQRYGQFPQRHPGLTADQALARLQAREGALAAALAMEASGGEPDFILQDSTLLLCDCSPESPAGRRSLCYDPAALDSRKDAKPRSSALAQARAMGVEVLDEPRYRFLQTLGEFDRKTSSWLLTPPAIRNKGGAIFGDRRYDHVFTYHNGAESYYAARGFRACIVL